MIPNSQIGFEDVESVREKRSFLRKDRVPVSSRGVRQPGVSIRRVVDDSSILIIPHDRWATSSDVNRRSSSAVSFYLSPIREEGEGGGMRAPFPIPTEESLFREETLRLRELRESRLR